MIEPEVIEPEVVQPESIETAVVPVESQDSAERLPERTEPGPEHVEEDAPQISVEEDVGVEEDAGAEPPQDESIHEVSEADPDVIPVIPGGWSSAERFEAFRAWLEAGGPRYEVWAKDCIFIEARPPVLRLEFPPGFRATHVSATNRDARLLKGVAAFFEGCTSVEIRNRADDSERMTHRETVAHEAAVAQQALEQTIADDADIATIAAHFDAAIRSVHKDYRSPTPPVLAPEEVH